MAGPQLNEVFGWLWVTLGFVTGAAMGMRFDRPGWLGGYDAWARRLVRLGHIALVMLGVLNILFAHSAARVALPGGWVMAASWCFIGGGVLMPVCCAAAARRPGAVKAFAAPVVLLIFAGTVVWVGMVRRIVSGE